MQKIKQETSRAREAEFRVLRAGTGHARSGVRFLAVVLSVVVAAWQGQGAQSNATASVRSCVVWVGGDPRLQITLDPGPADEKTAGKSIGVSVRAVNHRGESPDGFVGGHTIKLSGDGKPMTAVLPLLNQGVPIDRLWKTSYVVNKETITVPGDYIQVSVRDADLGLNSEELIYPFKPGTPLSSCTVRLTGGVADRKALFSLHFGPHKLGIEQKAAVSFRVLDAEGNQLSGTETDVALSSTDSTDYEKDVTPKRDATGPCTISFEAGNETLGMNVIGDARFPFASLLVPASAMESDTPADWHVPGKPLNDSDRGRVPNILFSAYQPFVSPVFDSAVKHSGERSLRIDYTPASTGAAAVAAGATIGSNVRLPGIPTAARIWVKGNNTRDKLVIEWRDPCNFSAAAYQRFMNSAVIEVCRLDFSDWKCFTVPVMGSGLLPRDGRSYMAGHSGLEPRHPLQVPMYCSAIRVIPEPPAKDAPPDTAQRSVWIDDLMVETQAPRNQRMTLELRGDTPERKLGADSKLFVSVGNGTPTDIRSGRIAVSFLDGDGEPVKDADLAEGIDVAAGEVAVKCLSLGALEKLRPRGPVTAVVTVTGPVAGQRVQGRVVFHRPTGAGLFWDFERSEHYNPVAPEWYYQTTYHKYDMAKIAGKFYMSLEGGNMNKNPTQNSKLWREVAAATGGDPVDGGADGSARALPLAVSTNGPVSVLLHPALPGAVESVEMQVFGEGVPVMLQALFVDSGSSEFDMPFQKFAGAPVCVDWKGWKSCRFAAPALPPGYATGTGNPYYAQRYPLNLAFVAWTENGTPAAIRIDQVRVSTHLARRQEIMAELEYPDETRLHVPGQPLRLVLNNFSTAPVTLDLSFKLLTSVGMAEAEGSRKVPLPPGARVALTLVDSLRQGFYNLSVKGLPDGRVLVADVQAPDRKRYFGETPAAHLADLHALNADLCLTNKKISLDWDTAEPVPDLYHHEWFRRYAAAQSEDGAYRIVPIVGYSADWAGPEKQLAVEDGTYLRDVGNYTQAPVRLADWNAFMRNVGREYARKFPVWVFWQSPDMVESPLYLPQEKYRSMFAVFHRWIKECNSNACTVAGGFSFDRVLNYLDGMTEPDKLPFDEFEVRVSPGNGSVEEVQMEDFLEDLDARLKLSAQGRKAAVIDLDWVTGETVSMMSQAAYHARAAILLHVVGALPHQFESVNGKAVQDGFGLLFRPFYGNSSVQNQRPFYVPKPAYFALIETRKMLSGLTFVQRAYIADRDPQASRIYLFKQADGKVVAAVWRVKDGRSYRLPAEWKSAATAVDAFGEPVALDKVLPVGIVPTFLRFASMPVDRVAHDLRNLQPVEAEKPYALVLDFVPSEAYSRQAAEYKATGGEAVERHSGRLPAGERVHEFFLKNVSEERFAFQLDTAGDVLMSRLWFLDPASGTNRVTIVSLNGGPEQVWTLAPMAGFAGTNQFDKFYVAGPKRCAFVLRGCKAGRNEVVLRHAVPSATGGFRLTRVIDGRVDLTAAGPLALAAGNPVQPFRNAAGGGLMLGKQSYASGIGCQGNAAIEYPLNRQFSKFEVTVGIDAVTRGKGTVAFTVYVDGKEKKKSGLMSGMTIPKTLTVDGLDNAERLVLHVDDTGDGADDNDLADWVDPVLYLKEGK